MKKLLIVGILFTGSVIQASINSQRYTQSHAYEMRNFQNQTYTPNKQNIQSSRIIWDWLGDKTKNATSWLLDHPKSAILGFTASLATAYGIWNFWSSYAQDQARLKKEKERKKEEEKEKIKLTEALNEAGPAEEKAERDSDAEWKEFEDEKNSEKKNNIFIEKMNLLWQTLEKDLNLTREKTVDPILDREAPYIAILQKITLDNTNQPITLDVIGDLHGDFGHIENVLQNLEKKGKYDPNSGELSENTYLIFLGDYIDRGPNSIKNLFYLTNLKANNPQQVFLLRGNHEYENIYSGYGFWGNIKTTMYEEPVISVDYHNSREQLLAEARKNEETEHKQLEPTKNSINQTFALLPSALFINFTGSDERLAFAHAGIKHDLTPEEKAQIKVLLDHKNATNAMIFEMNDIKELHKKAKKAEDEYKATPPPTGRARFYSRRPVSFGHPANPFTWNDIHFNSAENTRESNRGVKGIYIVSATDYTKLLNHLNINTLFRGHQQNNEEAFTKGKWLGIASSWDKINDKKYHDKVITLNVAPRTNYYETCNTYYTAQGTWARLWCYAEQYKGQRLATDDKNNKAAKKIASTDHCILEPIYYAPK